MRVLTLSTLAVAAILAIGACSSRTGATGDMAAVSERPPAETAPSPTASSPAPRSVETAPAGPATIEPSRSPSGMAGHGHAVNITISDFSFQPDRVEAAVGQVVSWTNADGEPHTVRSADGRISSPIVGSTPFEWTVEGTPGSEVAYICSIHPGMTGSVTIAA